MVVISFTTNEIIALRNRALGNTYNIQDLDKALFKLDRAVRNTR